MKLATPTMSVHWQYVDVLFFSFIQILLILSWVSKRKEGTPAGNLVRNQAGLWFQIVSPLVAR